MGYFLCYCNLVVLFFLGLPATGKANPLLELSSREEWVHLAGYGEEKLSTILVVGSVHCLAWSISGAEVAVQCQTGETRKSIVAIGITDDFGDFVIEIPSHLHAIPNVEEVCSVRVHHIPKNLCCQPAYGRRHKGISISSVGNGVRTYSAGKIRLFPASISKPLQACVSNANNQKEVMYIPIASNFEETWE